MRDGRTIKEAAGTNKEDAAAEASDAPPQEEVAAISGVCPDALQPQADDGGGSSSTQADTSPKKGN